MRLSTTRGDGAIVVETYPKRFSDGTTGYQTKITVTTDAAHDAIGHRGLCANYDGDEDHARTYHRETVERIDALVAR